MGHATCTRVRGVRSRLDHSSARSVPPPHTCRQHPRQPTSFQHPRPHTSQLTSLGATCQVKGLSALRVITDEAEGKIPPQGGDSGGRGGGDSARGGGKQRYAIRASMHQFELFNARRAPHAAQLWIDLPGVKVGSPHISPHLPTSPHISPHLPTSPHISHTPLSPPLTLSYPYCSRLARCIRVASRLPLR